MLQRPGCTPSGRSASGSRTEVRFALASRPPGAPRAFSLRHVCKCWDMHRGIEPRRGEQPSGLFTKERRRRDVSRRERSEAAGASLYALHDTPRGGNVGSGPIAWKPAPPAPALSRRRVFEARCIIISAELVIRAGSPSGPEFRDPGFGGGRGCRERSRSRAGF